MAPMRRTGTTQQAPRRRGRRTATAVWAVGAALVAGWAASGLPALATGTAAGQARVVDPATSDDLRSGGSTTPWTLRLPTAAACSGDSANNGYQVYSYIVPSSVDPATLTFNPNTGPERPAGSFAYPLVDNTGTPYLARNTAVTTGQIIDFPGLDFTFAVFSIDGRTGSAPLPAGTYNLGVACAHNGAEDRYWNAQLTFAPSTSDPSGETWTNPASTSTTTTTTSSSTTTTSTPRSSSTTTATTTATTSTSSTSTTSPRAATNDGTAARAASDPAAPAAAAATGSGASSGSSAGTAVLAATASAPGAPAQLPRTGHSPARLLLLGTALGYLGWVGVLLARRPRARLR